MEVLVECRRQGYPPPRGRGNQRLDNGLHSLIMDLMTREITEGGNILGLIRKLLQAGYLLSGQSLGDRPVRERRTLGDMGNRPHCNNGQGIPTGTS
jgi:hypothetical protein